MFWHSSCQINILDILAERRSIEIGRGLFKRGYERNQFSVCSYKKMESLGKYLREERQSRNLSLKEVSESTKIKERLLKAIEEDQYELLHSPVYVKGFLEAYARYLGLNPDDIILWYQKYHRNKIPPVRL